MLFQSTESMVIIQFDIDIFSSSSKFVDSLDYHLLKLKDLKCDCPNAGATLVVSGDGRYFSKEAIQVGSCLSQFYVIYTAISY
jgi:hypothetical protein